MVFIKEKFNQIKALVFDVDGVISSSQFYLHPTGEFIRSMNVKDGYSMNLAIRQGLIIGIITGGKNESVRTRMRGLGITDIYLGSFNKMDDFNDFLAKYTFKPEEVMYMGDDMPDLEIMQIVGVAACPADAVAEIKSVANFISEKNGGDGCVRDIIEQILKVQNKWITKNIKANMP